MTEPAVDMMSPGEAAAILNCTPAKVSKLADDWH